MSDEVSRLPVIEPSHNRPRPEDGPPVPTQHIGPSDEWPPAVSDGRMPCSDCGQPQERGFDYRVTDAFWAQHVPDNPARLSVLCLPCLDARCGGDGLADALIEVQWTGTAHTVVLAPLARYTYNP